jgi:hypothetical protein
MSWISDGEAGSSVRAKLNSLMVPIGDPIVVSSPVNKVDISLPTVGYGRTFCLRFDGVRIDTGDLLGLLASPDAGATFYNSFTGPDFSYSNLSNTSGGPDVLGYITNTGFPGKSASGRLEIFAGDIDDPFYFYSFVRPTLAGNGVFTLEGYPL